MSATMGATERVARYVADVDYARAPAELEHRTRRAIVDLFAAAVAAREDAGFRIVRRVVATEAREGPCTIVPTGETTTPAMAALVNGAAGHALDYDDVSDTLYGHPTVTILPPLLAVAQARGSSGRALVDAYNVGFDVAVAIAHALPAKPHFDRGWHATASIGVMSATAALCRLMGLDVARTRHALGIAGSHVGSSRQNFGTMTKPLHPGSSGFSAVLSARLAEEGFTADPEQLEKPLGYFATFGAGSDLRALHRSLDAPQALLRDGLSFKKYPCCYNTHRSADAAIAIAAAMPTAARESIESVTLTLQPSGTDPLIHRRPTTGLQGKFSAEYVVAAGLLDGEVSLLSFRDPAVQRPAVQDLIRRIEVRESANPPLGDRSWDFAYAVLEVTSGGRVWRERVDVPRGDCRLPLTDAELDAKFLHAVEFSGSGWNGPALLREIRALPERRALGGFAAMTRSPPRD
ncbi:MAG: MmgE/PrpD family protein [Burkholderiales bacterium]|nr:MmgE/PrpD family protein [Burkholderiales bacterium]